MNSTFRLIILTTLILQIYGSAHYVKLHLSGDGQKSCILLTQETVKKFRGITDSDDNSNSIHVTTKDSVSLPANSGPDTSRTPDDSKIVEIYGKTEAAVQAHVDTICKSTEIVKPLSPSDFGGLRADPEIVQIVNNGDKSNRIDVVFMGDGYTAAERSKFFDDIARLTKDMFEDVTFKSYLPVFNIWAIYVESVESGIGYTGAKDTPFRLYREAGQLRGIYPGNPAYARQVCALTGTSGCDYPSLIANDDYYGGLGGEFVISTKSERTGTVVLRHEMGHNFVDVGEEYDGGSVYRGVNSARSLDTVGWSSWLTRAGPVREERQIYRLIEYPWHDLSTGQRAFEFTSDGLYSSWYIVLSVSAAKELDSLEFELDGQILPWQTRGSDDREFYNWSGASGFTAGQHSFIVRSKTTPTNPDIPRMIASIRIYEYGNEDEFVHSHDHVSAYPTWDTSRRKTYRPTNEACSMRNMTSSVFCPVCQEGMWMQFFRRISLIDSIDVDTSSSPARVTVNTVKLGQLRDADKLIPGEVLWVNWYRNNVEQLAFRDQFTVQSAAPGNWRVEVKFITPEVRHDPLNYLFEQQNFVVV